MVHLSPGIRTVEPYPFEELDRGKAAARRGRSRRDRLRRRRSARGDAGVHPRGATDAIEPISSYPRAAGLPELREAIAGWVARRFDAALDQGTQILPTLGSKEIVFSLAQAVLDPAGGRDLVVVTAPGLHDPRARRALRRRRCAAPPARRSERVPAGPGRRRRRDVGAHRDPVAELPEQPHGRRGAAGVPRRGRRPRPPARRSSWPRDEAYSELWFDGEPPASRAAVRRPDERARVNTLSKRSSMTGYRSGFAAGDPR